MSFPLDGALRLLRLIIAYRRCRRLHFDSRLQLERHQARQLRPFLARLSAASAYFAEYRGLPLERWPRMDKPLMMAHFDSINTAGLRLAQVLEVALRAERSRDFAPAVKGITVGLSSGTSGQRAVFAVSAREQAQWAGVLLAKALPGGLLGKRPQRVALLLRAGSNLYRAVRTPWLTFRYFDLFQPFAANVAALAAYRPTVLVAPAQVLRQLALAPGALAEAPPQVISVAEVLEPQDWLLLKRAFGMPHQLYQATEGFLASSCEHGVLHLNEEYLQVEPEWLDGARRRFVPVITDFSRFTQPIVRYRMDDILVARTRPCACGRVTLALDAIEGRCDDQLLLPAAGGAPLPVFGDLLARALAQALPLDADYRLVQDGPASLRLHAPLAPDGLLALRGHLERVLAQQGVHIAALHWRCDPALPLFDPTSKRRRIVREAFDHA